MVFFGFDGPSPFNEVKLYQLKDNSWDRNRRFEISNDSWLSSNNFLNINSTTDSERKRLIIYTEHKGCKSLILGNIDTGCIIKKLSFLKNEFSYIFDLCIWNDKAEVNDSKKINLLILGSDQNHKSHLKVVGFDSSGLNKRENKELPILDVCNLVKTIIKAKEETGNFPSLWSDYKEVLLIFGRDSSINMLG